MKKRILSFLHISHPYNMKKHVLTIIAFLLLILFCVTLLAGNGNVRQVPSEPISLTEIHLDTVITLSLYDSQDEDVLKKAMELCASYEDVFSRTSPNSELYKLNHRELPSVEGKEHTYEISPELASLISTGLAYSENSNGAFHTALAPVTSLWNFTAADPKVPAKEAIAAALRQCSYENVTLQGNEITLPSDGTRFDLGAIAKGYIADRLKDYLLEQGVHSALINLGGNILCVGEKPSNSPFIVGIQKPFSTQGEYLLTLEDQDFSVVTSGIYQRYFEEDGVLYHHIIDPSTGYPYENDLASVTILSKKSLDGDALSTTCFGLGLEKGLAYLDKLPDTYGIFITKEGEIVTSENLPESVGLTELQ